MDAPAPGAAAWRRGASGWLLGAFVLFFVAGGAGDTASPVLVVHLPLLLVALNPRARNVLLASRTVGLAPLLAVALARRLIVVPVLFRLGRIHGDASLAWVERRFARTGRWMRRVERWFDRAAVPVVLVLPGMLTGYLAGSTGMRERLVLALNAASIMVRLVALLVAGNLFSAPLTVLLQWIAAHQWPLLSASLVVGVFQVLRIRRRLVRRSAPAGAVRPEIGGP